jgi:long-chain fatty acid transport protein
MPAAKGWTFLAGAAIIAIDASFTQDTTFQKFEGDVPTAVVPHAFVNYQRDSSSRLAYGFGVYVPYGLTSQWHDDFPGRFQALKASLQTIYIQPNVSYRLNDKWSVGGGPVFGYSKVQLKQALDLSEQVAAPGVTFAQLGIPRRTEFARANLDGNGTAFGLNIGVFGKPADDWSVGLRFLTPLEFTYDGAEATFTQVQTGLILPPGNPICAPPTRPPFCSSATDVVDVDNDLLAAQFAAGGRLIDQGVETKITHPAQIQAGVGYSGFQDWLVSFDYAWTGWRRFKELPVRFLGPASGSNRVLIENYNNTSAFRASAQRSFTGGAAVRFGFSGVASAAPDETVTALLPEQDRAYLSLGGEYPVMNNWALQGAYLRVMAPGKRGRVVERTSLSQTAAQLNTGKYELSANVFSLSLKGSF